MSNHETILRLKLTTIGQEEMTRLLYAGIKPKLKLGLGKSSEPITGEEKGIEEKFFISPDTLITLSKAKGTRLQVQTSLLGSDLAFDIYQIGLFISNSDAGIESLSLLAFYQGKQILAKKLVDMDLFLDIIVDLSDYSSEAFTIDASEYKPLFNMIPATTERYGTVRLATSQIIQDAKLKGLALTTELLADRNNILKREPGFILTTNNLDSFVSSTKSLKTKVFAEGSIDLPMAVDSVLFLAFNAEGGFRNSFFAIKSFNKSYLFLLRYPAKDIRNIKLVNLQEVKKLQEQATKQPVLIPEAFFGSGECCDADNIEEGGKNYYFFSVEGLSKLSIMFKNEGNPELAIQSILNFRDGRFFFYNTYLGILHADILTLLDPLLNEKGTISLRYGRNKPLVQVVQDKIYCFGGLTELNRRHPFVEIHQAYFNNNKPVFSSYVPISNSPIEDISNYIACTVGFRIYFFSLNSFVNGLQELGEIYYQYDTLNNHWLRNAFTVESCKLFPKPFSKVAFISYGTQISAFFVHSLPSKKELNYTIIVFSEL